MWIHTDEGFLSIVRNNDDPSTLIVRARAYDDLLSVGNPDGIWFDPTADYPWRTIMPRHEFATVMAAKITDGIDYPNFKSQVANTLGRERAHLLHDVWATLTGIERIADLDPI